MCQLLCLAMSIILFWDQKLLSKMYLFHLPGKHRIHVWCSRWGAKQWETRSRRKTGKKPRSQKNRDHDFSDNSSDQGTTERLEQEIDQSGKFWGRRGDSGGKGAAAGTNVADKDVHEGLDEETDLEYVKKN